MADQNQNPKLALADKIKDSKNILVTVSTNPNVDQLAACLGLTLWLNKIDKHATAVFSGEVPSTLEFLQPDETLEKDTDSLRDFIISLDKSKADKLRYKVEDSVVKVFVTPYRTSLSADDLEFSQGDFNVDMVIALGVHSQAELDAAITAHGRILHDATVATITIGDAASELGSIGWHDAAASSLSELIVDLSNSVEDGHIDNQIATALLTGVVAETERFSNDKTTPQTMSVSAQLMSAGADQQLVASKLEEPASEPVADEPTADEPSNEANDTDKPADDGSISIEHDPDADPEVSAEVPEQATDEQPEVSDEADTEGAADPVLATQTEPGIDDVKETAPDAVDTPEVSHFADQQPDTGGTLTANAVPEDITTEPPTDPFSLPAVDQSDAMLAHEDTQVAPAPADPADLQPAPPSWMPPQPWMNQPAPDAAPVSDVPADIELPEAAPADMPAPVAQSEEVPSLPAVEPQSEAAVEPEATPEPEPTPEPAPEAEASAPDEPAAPEQPPVVEEAPVTEQPPELDAARDEVMKAINSVPDENPAPVEALNAQPIDLNSSSEPLQQLPQDPFATPAAEAAPVGEPAPEPEPTPSFQPGSTQFNAADFQVMNDAAPEPAPAPDAPAVDPNQPVDPELTGPVEQPFTMPLPDASQPQPPAPTTVEYDPNGPPPVPPPLPQNK